MTVWSASTIESVCRYACSTRVSRVRCGVPPHRVARKKFHTLEQAGASTGFQAGRLKQPAFRGCYSMVFDV